MIPPDSLPERSSADDRALVQRIAESDVQALSALYDRHSQMVYSHAIHLLGDVAEGEDAVEETFWRVWRRAGDYDAAAPDVPTWLLMLCRQRAAERLRAKKRSSDRLIEDPTGLGSGDASDGAKQDTGRTAAALAQIPADQRTVLELAFFRGMAPTDVATVTKQSPETARTRLRVAMRKLRDALAENAPSPASTEASP